MTENERVKQLRKARGLTLEKFGERLGVTKVAISLIENGKNSVTDQMRRSICREFGVREEWLRDGTEPMETTRSDALEADIRKFLTAGSDSFRERLISLLLRLEPEQWETLEQYARELVEPSTPEQRARHRADDFYEEALAEEQVADSSSASQPTGAREA